MVFHRHNKPHFVFQS